MLLLLFNKADGSINFPLTIFNTQLSTFNQTKLCMKKSIILFVAVLGFIHVKAQTNLMVKPVDSLSINISNSIKSFINNQLKENAIKPNFSQPNPFLSYTPFVQKPDGANFSSKMPVVALDGNSKMPVVKPGGYYTMPVKKIGSEETEGTFTPSLMMPTLLTPLK